MFYQYFDNLIEADVFNPRFGKKLRVRVTFSYWWRMKWNRFVRKLIVKDVSGRNPLTHPHQEKE